MRNVFPDSAYEKRKWDGTKIKILKGKASITGSRQLVDTVKSALKCIESHQLVRMYLVLRKRHTQEAIEVYTFSFAYNEEVIKCFIQMTSEEQEMDLKDNNQEMPETLKNSIKKLLFNMESLAKELPSLQGDTCLTLHLEVKDSEDFVMPDMFDNVELNISFPQDVRTIKLGHADSKFTSFGVSSKSNLSKEVFEDDDVNEESSYVKKESNTLFRSSTIYPSNTVSPNENSETVKLTDTMSSVHLRDNEVNCICERSDDIFENVQCAACFTYQHKACYKLLDNQTIDRHICVNCHSETRMCTNVELLNEEGKEEALYRRALSLCENNTKVSVNTFVSHLNVSRKEAIKIFQRLVEEGCFFPESKERNIRIVNLEHLKSNILNLYFNTKNNQDMESMDTEEYIPGSNEEEKMCKRQRTYESEFQEGETNQKRYKYARSTFSDSSVTSNRKFR